MSTLHASQDLINLIKQINLDTNYPIGSIYLSFDKNSPGSRLGGTWQLCGSGRYLMCYDPNNTWFDKPGSDRGTASGPGNWRSDNTSLSIAQIPSHNHTLYFNTSWGSEVTEIPVDGYAGPNTAGQVFTRPNDAYFKTYGATQYGKILMKNTGSGQGHNHFHVSPYMTVCVWERTA